MNNIALISFFAIGVLGIAYYANYARYARKRIIEFLRAKKVDDFEIKHMSLRRNAHFFEIEYKDLSGANRKNSGMVYGWILPDSDIFWEDEF